MLLAGMQHREHGCALRCSPQSPGSSLRQQQQLCRAQGRGYCPGAARAKENTFNKCVCVPLAEETLTGSVCFEETVFTRFVKLQMQIKE